MGRIIPHTMENKNISQLGVLFPIYGKFFHVPNHQPVYVLCITDKK
jgi:hypothetical protein